MTISNRALALAAAALALTFAGPAAAQDDYDQGKTGPQLFASDCGICHESPRGLMKTVNPSGLQSFLSVHYTAPQSPSGPIARIRHAIQQRAGSVLTHAHRLIAAVEHLSSAAIVAAVHHCGQILTPLLEEEGHASGLALVAQASSPVRMHRPRAGPALATNDSPGSRTER